MSDCPQSPTGHELEYKEMFGTIDDPVRVRQRTDCIHCGRRMWVIYERSHLEDVGNDERGWPLQQDF